MTYFLAQTQQGHHLIKKPNNGVWAPLEDDYDDYYEQIHDDAMSGDLDAQAEMREEFGDDWEGEY